MPLTTFTAGTVIRSADVNANFALCLLKENVNTDGGILFGNGTTATQDSTNLFWDSTNKRLGIGLASPSVTLDMYSATSAISQLWSDSTVAQYLARSSSDAASPDLFFRKTRGTKATVASAGAVATSDVIGRLLFQVYGGSNYRTIAYIQSVVDTYTSDTDISSRMSFYTTPTGSITASERMRIDPSGQVGIGVTPTSRNNTRLQIVDGIGFPATQVSSSDANTLDDYEEGSYTPTITANTGTFTTVSATGHYTKIGRVVKVCVTITITTNGTAATTVNFSVPFTSTADHEIYGCGRERATTGFSVSVAMGASTTTAACRKYDGTYPGGTGNIIEATIIYYV